jgi:serine/threonine protein kinase
VLELLEGVTLLQLIQSKPGELLSSKEIKTIMEGLLKGLAHLVKNRVMHRDIKP